MLPGMVGLFARFSVPIHHEQNTGEVAEGAGQLKLLGHAAAQQLLGAGESLSADSAQGGLSARMRVWFCDIVRCRFPPAAATTPPAQRDRISREPVFPGNRRFPPRLHCKWDHAWPDAGSPGRESRPCFPAGGLVTA